MTRERQIHVVNDAFLPGQGVQFEHALHGGPQDHEGQGDQGDQDQTLHYEKRTNGQSLLFRDNEYDFANSQFNFQNGETFS